MSLQLICGSAGVGKSYQLYREIIRMSIDEPETNYLVIVPEQFTLQTQKDIVGMHPDKGVMNIDILSFQRFAYRIFDEVGAGNQPVLEDTGKSMVIRRVLAGKKKQLLLFGQNASKAGFVGELKSMLSELYQYNIGEEDFARMWQVAEKRPVLKAKLQDLFIIYQGFREFMRDRYITAEEILVVLYNIIDKSCWVKNTVICLDGFTGFTPCQYKILEKMLRYAKKVYVTVTIDPRELAGFEPGLRNGIECEISEHQLFGLSKKTIHKLYKIAKTTGVDIKEPVIAEKRSGQSIPYRFINSPALASLEHNIFRYPYKTFNDRQEDITIHAARDAAAEMDFVVREIKKLVREEKYRYKDIAVVTGDITEYGRIARQKFAQAGIPCFIDYKKDILNNPFVELVRAAVAIVAEDFDYESVFRYLRTYLTDLSPQEIDMLENYVLACGIRGYKRWSEPFERKYRSNEPLKLEQLNEARQKFMQDIVPVYEALKNKENSISDYTRAVYELGVRLHIEEKLEGCQAYFADNNQPVIAKEFEQVYRIVMELYDQMVLLLGREKCSIAEFADILDTGFMEARVGLIPPGVDEVVVGDTERTRLKDIKALFFVGANDGLIPKPTGSGGILSDMDREFLAENNIELAPTKRQQSYTEQFYIYLNLTKPGRKLYISYHKVNEEGKAVGPSFLIGKIKQLFPAAAVTDEDNKGQEPDILRDDGLSYLTEGLRNLDKGNLTDEWKELYLYYRSNEKTAFILDRLIHGAMHINKEKGISREAARLLYGSRLDGSVSRLERFAGCAFAHFLEYGLSLEERMEFKLAVPDIGNIFHNAIDYFSKKLDESSYSWHDIPDNIRQEWARECVRKAVEEYENSFIKSTKRSEYMITRMERIVIRTLWALCSQIRQGVFEPVGYEMKFYELPELKFSGRIDRLDLYEDEKRVYVRVIDYKSGATYFDLAGVYYGLQLQLSVYLIAAMDYLSRQHPDKEIVPAGILYYHIDDPIVAKSEQSQEEIYKSLKMDGLVNADKSVIALMDKKLAGPDGSLAASCKSDIIPVETNKEGELGRRSQVADSSQFTAMLKFVKEQLMQDCGRILDGDTALNPYRMGEQSACDYCRFRSVCGFDSRLGRDRGFEFRNLAKKSLEEIKAEIFDEERQGK